MDFIDKDFVDRDKAVAEYVNKKVCFANDFFKFNL